MRSMVYFSRACLRSERSPKSRCTRHHLLGDLHRLIRTAEADHVAGPREGVGLAVRHAHAAADHDVVADDAAAFLDGDEPEIVREHVDVVVRRQRDRDLELARHVGAAVDRLVFRLATGDLLAVDPDLVPGAAFRQQVRADRLRQPRHLGMRPALPWIDTRDHVAVHVAACRDGVEHRVVHAADREAQVALDDAVELDGLPRRQPQRAVATLDARSSPPPAIAAASARRPARAAAP